MTRPIWEHVIFLTLGTLCLILNSSEIVLIFKKRKSIKTFELILLSFAVADLIVGLAMITYAIYDTSQRTTMTSLGPIEYFIFTMQCFAVCSSIAHILGINVERLLAVRFPLGHQRCKSRKNTRLIAVIWFIAIVLAVVVASPDFIFLSYCSILFWNRFHCNVFICKLESYRTR